MAEFKDWLKETATSTSSIASFVRPCMPLVKRDPFHWSADSDKKKKKKKKDEATLNESADVLEEAKYIHTVLSEREKKQEDVVKSAEHEEKHNAGKSKKKTTSGARCRITKPEVKKKATCPTCGAKVDVDDLKKVPFSLQKNGIKKYICSKCPKE